jgi:PAS domain S-box-containing protein
MIQPSEYPLKEDTILRKIVEGTALFTGDNFFKALVKNLAEALDVHGAWVTEYDEENRRLRAYAFWLGDDWVDHYEYDIKGTPCEPVIDYQAPVHIPENVIELFPKDPDLPPMKAVSYMGIPLKDADRKILGHLAVLDTKPMKKDPRLLAIFRIFAARATAEMQRLSATQQLRENETNLRRLFENAMDAIIELDDNMRIHQINPAAGKLFKASQTYMMRKNFSSFLNPESLRVFRESLRQLDKQLTDAPNLWISEGLTCLTSDGRSVPVEATLSRSEKDGQKFHILILRDINYRLEAEKKIRSLTIERNYLEEEIRSHHNFDEIIGESPAIKEALDRVRQVAGTNASVLISGETGTGKELFARAIHKSGRRSEKPVIKLNCAALPANLIESELFGHEKGAFTGATAKREGRFKLADGGTIFLDEIGELPLDLQAKLLRVLQEGEFEPVGSSNTVKVDVRVIAATNRDLPEEIKKGKFREDLYYRLNVFPLQIPPLRDRGRDVVLIASAIAGKYAKKMGKRITNFSEREIRKLLSYSWPGNVRELQNVIERAVITSPDGGELSLDQELKVVNARPNEKEQELGFNNPRIYTQQELGQLERENIIRALKATNWKVSGKNGAAELLHMPPSTLSSRIKALNISQD